MDTSFFTNKDKAPSESELKKVIGKNHDAWTSIRDFIFKNSPGTFEEWNFSKYGWNCRIKDKKRAIIYLMPCENYFRASFALGEKATKEILQSNVSAETKEIISSAKVYAEGRGVRLDVKNKNIVKDILQIVSVKIST